MDNNADLNEVQADEPSKPVAAIDVIYAFLFFLFGFLFVKYSITSAIGAGMTGFVVVFVAFSLFYAKKKGVSLKVPSLVWAALILIFSVVFVLSDNKFLKGWNLFFICLMTVYWYYTMFGCRENNKVDGMLGFDLFKAAVILPFAYFGKIFAVIVNGIKQKRGLKRIGFVVIGLIIALIPSAVVLSLLLKADKAFSSMIDYMCSDIGEIIGVNLAPAFLGIFVAMYLFGLLYACSEKKCADVLSREKNEKILTSCHSVSTVIICSALIPLMIIYILFLISQAGYFGAFKGIIPEGITSAEYARQGFFELCSVSAVNAAVIGFTLLFAKRKENNSTGTATRFFIVAFSLLTIALISTALCKMILYIGSFGYTQKRIYASWLIILLGVLFILLIIKQFANKMNYMKSALVAFIILFGALQFCNVDAVIAKYSVEHYLSKDFETLDLTMFERDLSFSAVPYLEQLLDSDVPDKMRKDTESLLQKYAQKYNFNRRSNFSFRSYNVPAAKAANLLKEKGYTQQEVFGWEW
jgi:hypothetical protein